MISRIKPMNVSSTQTVNVKIQIKIRFITKLAVPFFRIGEQNSAIFYYFSDPPWQRRIILLFHAGRSNQIRQTTSSASSFVMSVSRSRRSLNCSTPHIIPGLSASSSKQITVHRAFCMASCICPASPSDTAHRPSVINRISAF